MTSGGADRWLFRAFIVLGLALVYAPIITVIAFSFNDARFPSFPWSGFTLRWYEILESPLIQDALQNSFVVSAVVGLLAVVLGGSAAYCLNRFEFRGKTPYLIGVTLPPTIPVLILGLGILIFLRQVGLNATLTGVVIAHVVFTAAFALGIIRMGLAEKVGNLEQVAWNLGASQGRAIWDIVIPQIIPNLIAAGLLAAVVSFDEFIMAWFISGFDVTLPVRIYEMLSASISPEINALGATALVISAVLAIGAYLLLSLGRRSKAASRAAAQEGEGVTQTIASEV